MIISESACGAECDLEWAARMCKGRPMTPIRMPFVCGESKGHGGAHRAHPFSWMRLDTEDGKPATWVFEWVTV